MLGAVIVVLIVFLSYLMFFKEDHCGKILSTYVRPTPLPIVGNLLSFMGPNEKIIATFLEWYKIYGGRFVYRIGSWWVVVIASAKDVEKVLSSQVEITKSVDYDQLVPWLGTGLLISSGKKWFHRRKMLTSAFHFKILEQFVPVFNDASVILAHILRERYSDGENFDVVPYITRCTLDSICETAMGLEMNAQRDGDSEYARAIHRMGDIQQYRAMRPWLEPTLIWKLTAVGKEEATLIQILHDFTNKVIRERKEKFITERQLKEVDNPENKRNRKPAFLDLLFEAQENPENQLSDDGIREETDTFMFEGHDTTASGVSFTIFALGCHPEFQAKVHEELDQIFDDDKQRPVNISDLNRMKYLECCIKESLRILPSVPLIARTYQNDFQLDDNAIIPKGAIVVVPMILLHRDPKVFPEPEKYQPDRFLPENCVNRSPFAYVPFSAGPRNCIGQKFAMMEAKIILANVFRKLQVTSVESLDSLVLLSSLVLRSKNGLRVSITPREN